MSKKYIIVYLVLFLLAFTGCNAAKIQSEYEGDNNIKGNNIVEQNGINNRDVLSKKKTIQIDISVSKDYTGWNPEISKSIKDINEVDEFVNVFRENPPPPKEEVNKDGTVITLVEPDMPNYDIRVTFDDNTSQVYKLWVSDSDKRLFYTRSDETGYLPGTISGEGAEKISGMIKN